MKKIEDYKLGTCPRCHSKNTGVDKWGRRLLMVGCRECSCKTIAYPEDLDYTVKWWNEKAKKGEAAGSD